MNDIKKAIELIAADRKVTMGRVSALWDAETAEFNPYIVDLLEESAYDYGDTVKKMPSDDGHDVKYMHQRQCFFFPV